MTEHLLDENDNLTAFVEYCLCDKKGHLDDKGEYVFVFEFYVNPEERNRNTIARFAHKIMAKIPWARYCYYERRKYGRLSKLYPKRKWVALVNKYLNKEIDYERTSNSRRHTS